MVGMHTDQPDGLRPIMSNRQVYANSSITYTYMRKHDPSENARSGLTSKMGIFSVASAAKCCVYLLVAGSTAMLVLGYCTVVRLHSSRLVACSNPPPMHLSCTGGPEERHALRHLDLPPPLESSPPSWSEDSYLISLQNKRVFPRQYKLHSLTICMFFFF